MPGHQVTKIYKKKTRFNRQVSQLLDCEMIFIRNLKE